MKRTVILIFGLTLATGIWAASASRNEQGRWASEMDGWFLDKKSPWILDGARGASFTPDGKQAVIALEDGGLACVDLRNQKIRQVIDFSLLLGHEDSRPQAVAVSPLGIIAAAFPERHEVILIDRAKMRVSERIKTAFPARQLRFSPQGKYLFIGHSNQAQTWPAIYSVKSKEYLLSRIEPMIADISRDDRYLYLYDPDKHSMRWLICDTLETVRYFSLATISVTGHPQTMRILRDHRIALGYRGAVLITDRYLQRVELSHPIGYQDITLLEPSHDNRFLIFGSADQVKVLSTVNNLSQDLILPDAIRGIGVYPNGNFMLYLDTAHQSLNIIKITLPNPYSSGDPSAIMSRN